VAERGGRGIIKLGLGNAMAMEGSGGGLGDAIESRVWSRKVGEGES
jgi:hypothetical protein